MAGTHSKLSVVKLDNAAGSLTTISTFCDSCEVPQDLEEADVTTFGAGSYRDFISGFASGEVTLSGPWARAVDNFFEPLYEGFKAGTITSSSFEYGPEGTDAGDVKKTCELAMLSYSGPKADVGSPQKWDAKFRVKAPGVTTATY